MLFKILVLVLVLIAIYYMFFNKPSKKNRDNSSKNRDKNEQKEINSEMMIACAKCGVYVSAKEAIIKDGKYYCSNECANS